MNWKSWAPPSSDFWLGVFGTEPVPASWNTKSTDEKPFLAKMGNTNLKHFMVLRLEFLPEIKLVGLMLY